MVKKCIVCKKTYFKGCNLSFHRVPVEMERRVAWSLGLGIEFPKTSCIHVCSDHFAENDFTIGNVTARSDETVCRKQLRSTATPGMLQEIIAIEDRLKETDKKVYKCAICGFQTLLKASHYRHKKTHLAPEERELFACIHCDKKYISKQGLRYHIEENHIDSRSREAEKEVYKCTMCRYETRREPSLRKHMQTHLAPEDRQLFVCTHCDKKYTTKKALQCHLDIKHVDSRLKETDKKVYKCAICGFRTLYSSSLRSHKKTHFAPEERKFACIHCGKECTTKQSLRHHIEDNHIDSRSKDAQKNLHKCSICSYQTLYISRLQQHQKIHLARDERQLFACAHCDKKYTEKGKLKFHLDAKHIDSRSKDAQKNLHKCSICSYQTPYITHLQRHQKIHLAPDERQLFACAHCDKKYTEKQRLKDHLGANHIDSRSKDAQKNLHKCSICGYQTPYISHFQRHQKIHLAPDERQLFACAHCDKKYTRKQKLKFHLDANHIDSRNADCTSSTDEEVILDALKIEIDDVASPLDDSKNFECLSVTNEIKSEDFIKTEPEDVAPIKKTEVHDDFKSSANESATRNVKLEDFIKMEPDDDV
ncbi:gastrula zinc finger protein XlCGF57.1-like [Sitophilus oryzae]|uniref:Gastrula zinc finger protein XlCGF57.1-like n=1 Tax=Sitophilus oryzae TaxID=7048 RepID=A0A6J2Y646_SITOR|nr:gastrula zinc finger protein XlCGF57.1-like [Sitophilus oryzae]